MSYPYHVEARTLSGGWINIGGFTLYANAIGYVALCQRSGGGDHRILDSLGNTIKVINA